MRIGIDLRTAEGEAGVAQYGRNLAAALQVVDPDDQFFFFKKEKRVIPFWTSHLAARLAFAGARLDILHIAGGTAPILYRRPYVLTVHDLAIYRHPEWFPDGQWFSTRVSFPSSVRLARHIIVPSVSTKNDLADIMGVNEEKISVIPHGVAMVQAKKRPGMKPYILFIGTIEPRKNVTALIRAYRRLIDEEKGLERVELYIAGKVGWKSGEIMDEIQKTQCQGYKISLLGEVTGEKKWELVTNAAVMAFPTLYEGFGLPILEAMACGTPVACSNNSSLPEAAGDAALFIDPREPGSIAGALKKILTDKKIADELRMKGLARAAAFTWERTARATLEAYRRAVR